MNTTIIKIAKKKRKSKLVTHDMGSRSRSRIGKLLKTTFRGTKDQGHLLSDLPELNSLLCALVILLNGESAPCFVSRRQ